MSLLEKQRRFARMVGVLIGWAYDHGYELTLGDAYRDPRCPYGSEVSLHKQRLAIDLNLYIEGVYQKTTEAHKPLGEFWESIGGAGGGGGGGRGYATGGSFVVGGPGGTDNTPVSFMATRGERVTVETPAQQKASDNGSGSVNMPVKIVNVLPSQVTEEMSSSEGERVILNVITRNRATVKGVIAS